LCKNTNINSAHIELVCVVTQNPDQKIPHTAAIVHQKLGLGKRCMTFDISQGCAGFTHGLSIVSALMNNFNLHSALLFTCDPYSKIVDPNDKNTALLFGDAATVTFLTNDDEAEGYTLIDTHFGTLPGSYECLMCIDKLQMNGRDVLNNALREIPENIHALLSTNQLAVMDIDLFVFHQASKLLIQLLRDILELNEQIMPFNILNIGNTISSSIPIMLKEHIANKSKQQIVLSGFGVGFSFASSLIKLINKGY
jgi:3-oxoacyl-[acyl-carrier-protein] synthase III